MKGIKVSIDTAYLVAELTSEQFEFVRGQFHNRFRIGNVVYRFRYYNFDLHYGLFMGRIDGYKPRHYNTLIRLHHHTIENMPTELKRALSVGNWRIKRLDVAYDFETPLSRHFILKHGNTKIRRRDSKQNYGRNYYVASKNARVQAYIYDKKRQLNEKYGIEIPEDNITRFELRIRPKISYLQTSLLNLELDWLQPQFERIGFVPDYTKTSLTTKQKEILRRVKTRENLNWIKSERNQKTNIYSILDDYKVDLWQEFNSRKRDLFKWLYLPQYNSKL